MIFPKSAKQKKFSLASIIERLVVKDFYKERADFLINEITAINSSDQHDCILMSAGTEYVTEIKVRSTTIEKYDQNWIELKKLIPLYCTGVQQNKKMWFVLSFSNGVAIWNVERLYNMMLKGEARIEYKTYAENTVTGNAPLESKPCLMLDRRWATVYFHERKPDIYLREQAESWYDKNQDSELIYQNWINPKTK